jgi:hypothetical protein
MEIFSCFFMPLIRRVSFAIFNRSTSGTFLPDVGFCSMTSFGLLFSCKRPAVLATEILNHPNKPPLCSANSCEGCLYPRKLLA